MFIKNYLLFSVFCFIFANDAYADFYSCKDNTGHIVTSDRPIPECADKSTQIYKDNGMLKDQISGALTPEQKREAQLKDKQKSDEAKRIDNAKREQRYLTAHYPDENAIELARKHDIDTLESKISAENKVLETATATLNQDQKALPLLTQNQPAKAAEFQQKIIELTQTIQESNRLIHNYRNEEINVNHQYDDIHKHYLDVVPAVRKQPGA